MNTHTNAMHPQKKAHRTIHSNLFHNTAIMTIILSLVIVAATAVYVANQPVVAAENSPTVLYGNALEMQYARPWLESQNKPVAAYSNALELQYAQPWLEAQNKPVVVYGNALELQYARPWLDAAQRLVAVTGSAQEQNPLDCGSNLEMFYACKYGYGHP